MASRAYLEAIELDVAETDWRFGKVRGRVFLGEREVKVVLRPSFVMRFYHLPPAIFTDVCNGRLS